MVLVGQKVALESFLIIIISKTHLVFCLSPDAAIAALKRRNVECWESVNYEVLARTIGAGTAHQQDVRLWSVHSIVHPSTGLLHADRPPLCERQSTRHNSSTLITPPRYKIDTRRQRRSALALAWMVGRSLEGR